MVKHSLVLLGLMIATAAADPPKIKGTFAFDQLKPKASRCAPVTGALLTKLTKDYQCAAPDGSVASASGVAIVASCKARKGESELLLFSTAKDCATERDTQMANGG